MSECVRVSVMEFSAVLALSLLLGALLALVFLAVSRKNGGTEHTEEKQPKPAEPGETQH